MGAGMGGTPMVGGRLLQRLRPWAIVIEGVTDGDESVINSIKVNGLTGMEFRTAIRDIADQRMPFKPGNAPTGGGGGGGSGAGGSAPVSAPGSGPESGGAGQTPTPGSSVLPPE